MERTGRQTDPAEREREIDLQMVLRIPLRRSASFTPDHQPLMEVSSPTALKMEANMLVMGANSVGKSGKNFNHQRKSRENMENFLVGRSLELGKAPPREGI